MLLPRRVIWLHQYTLSYSPLYCSRQQCCWPFGILYNFPSILTPFLWGRSWWKKRLLELRYWEMLISDWTMRLWSRTPLSDWLYLDACWPISGLMITRLATSPGMFTHLTTFASQLIFSTRHSILNVSTHTWWSAIIVLWMTMGLDRWRVLGTILMLVLLSSLFLSLACNLHGKYPTQHSWMFSGTNFSFLFLLP